MSASRALLLISVVSLAGAALVALASRAPAELRLAKAPPEASAERHGAEFTDEQIARHGAYRRTSYVTFGISVLMELAFLVILAKGPVGRVAGWAERIPGGWVTTALAVALFVSVALWLAGLPIGYVRGYVVEHAWSLSTQDASGWWSDRAKAGGIGAVVAAISALAFYGALRWQPDRWWVIGWISFSLLSVLLAFLWPLVIAPLFNRFTPLDELALSQRIRTMASSAGIELDEVLVADASRRTTAENAYVAGIGSSKRMVLYDTLLSAGDEEQAAYVAAHELGHAKEHHVWKNVALSCAGLLVGFLVLAWLAGRAGPWAWASAGGIGDPRGLPVLLLFVAVMTLVTLPLQNGVSRAFERRADDVALELTQDPGTAIEVHRRLAFSNLADLRPPRALVALLYTHPPVVDRIETAITAREGSPSVP